jgi:predicted transcriptional regulator
LSASENFHKRRDHLFIMAEILEVAIDGALKTQVMYRANLSFAQLNEYLRLMLDIKLLESVKNTERVLYKTTSKGVRYLQSYRELRDLLKKERSSSEPSNGNGGNGVYLVKRGSQVICSKGPFY